MPPVVLQGITTLNKSFFPPIPLLLCNRPFPPKQQSCARALCALLAPRPVPAPHTENSFPRLYFVLDWTGRKSESGVVGREWFPTGAGAKAPEPNAAFGRAERGFPMLKYAEIELDASTLPQSTLDALLQRGFAHVLGNEVSSLVVSGIRKAIISGSDRKADSVTTDEVKAFRVASAEVVAKLEEDAENAKLADMRDGKLGLPKAGATRAPRDPVQAELAKLTKAEVVTKLAGAGFKLVKDKETGTQSVTFPNGDVRTLDQMISTHLANNTERLTKEANRRVKASTVAKPEAPVTDASALGF